jgi:hypothetical protein
MGVGTAADGVVHGVELKYEDERPECESREPETGDAVALNNFKPGQRQAAGVNCYV